MVKTRVVKAQVDLEAEALELVLMIQEMQGVLTLVVAEVVDQSLLQAALVDQEL